MLISMNLVDVVFVVEGVFFYRVSYFECFYFVFFMCFMFIVVQGYYCNKQVQENNFCIYDF